MSQQDAQSQAGAQLQETAAFPVGDRYPRVDISGTKAGSVSFPELEQKVLRAWADDETFQASIDNRADAEEFVFYDGPPFANGLPHYGH